MPLPPHKSRRQRALAMLPPLLVALVLAALTARSRQWQYLVSSLPGTPTVGVYMWAPSGNEWRLRHWQGFGADRFEVRRTFTRDAEVDPVADATAAFAAAGYDLPEQLLRTLPFDTRSRRWRYAQWGWPSRHAGIDQLGGRHTLMSGLVLNTLFYTPLWLLVLHILRKPVTAAIAYLRPPPWACRKCRYDLRGLPEGAPCPECGRVTEP